MSRVGQATPHQWVVSLISLLRSYPPQLVAMAVRQVLARTGNRDLLPRIVAGLRQVVGEARVLVEMGQPLGQDVRNQLASALTTKFPSHPIIFRVSPDLLGGLRIHHGSILIDYSGREMLAQLASHLTEDK